MKLYLLKGDTDFNGRSCDIVVDLDMTNVIRLVKKEGLFHVFLDFGGDDIFGAAFTTEELARAEFAKIIALLGGDESIAKEFKIVEHENKKEKLLEGIKKILEC